MGKIKRKYTSADEVKAKASQTSKRNRRTEDAGRNEHDNANLNCVQGRDLIPNNKGTPIFPITRSIAKKLGITVSIGQNNNAVPEREVFANALKPVEFDVNEIISDQVEGDQEELDYLDDIDVDVETFPQEDGEFPQEEDEDEGLLSDSSEDDLEDTIEGSQVETGLDSVSVAGTEVTFKKHPSVANGGVKFDKLRGDPAFEKFIRKCVAKEIQNTEKGAKDQRGVDRRSSIPPPRVRSVVQKPTTTHSSATPAKGNNNGSKNKNTFIKSPSDTTLYAPALSRNPTLNLLNNMGIVPNSNEQPSMSPATVANKVVDRMETIPSDGRGDKLSLMVTEDQIAKFNLSKYESKIIMRMNLL